MTATDDSRFTAEVERYRPELHAHCYRMLRCPDRAEDAVQETLLRAWRHRTSFEGRSSVRTWLYRIATNACLDAVRSRPLDWDGELDEIVAVDPEPDTVVVAKERLELALLAAIQVLPAKQRAVLILRDVLRWTAAETASLLGTSVPAVNSALQRCRATLKQHFGRGGLDWVPASAPTAADRCLLERYVDAMQRTDVAALVAQVREEAGALAA